MSLKPAQQKQAFAKDEASAVARHLLDLEILYLLNPEPKSGYQLKKYLLNTFRINISYGTLYPHLHSLEKSKLILGTWNSQDVNEPLKKKIYSLTNLGADRLRSGVQGLGKIALTMQFFLTGVNPILPEFKHPEGVETAFKTAIQFLSDYGYTAKSAVLVRGASGLEYSVEILASRFDSRKNETEKLAIKVLNPEGEPSMEDILKLYVMFYDLQLSKMVVLSLTNVREDLLRMADFCQILLYFGKDLTEAVSNMCSNFPAAQHHI
jgi:DNA-binding PadR family transcriptional regulator